MLKKSVSFAIISASESLGVEKIRRESTLTCFSIVRRGGKILVVGTLSTQTHIDTKLCIKKRISVLFNYGGQYQDVVDVLDLIAKKAVKPIVETGDLKDFPAVLQMLHEGKIKSRMALIPSHS